MGGLWHQPQASYGEKMSTTSPTVFDGPSELFVADTCSPLREAGESGAVKLAAYGRGSYPGEPISDGVLDQLNSVGTWEASFDQDWGLDWHRNEGIEFTCVTSGTVDFSCEGEDYQLTAGDITITRPWQLHRVGRPNVTASTLTWFIIDVGVRRPNQEWVWPSWLPISADELSRMTELLSHNERPVWRANKAVTETMAGLERALKRGVSQPMSRIGVAVAEVFIELRDLLEQEGPVLNPYLSSTERTVKLFLSRLHQRLDEPWTVDDMAAECGLGRTRFAHYCKQMINVTPLEYLSALRIERAADLLAETDLKVADIAFMCGFQSSQYFATTFRRRFQRGPLEHRKLHAAATLA